MMMPKPNPRMMAQHVVPAHHHNPYEMQMPRAMRPSGRMCSNPQCKNPFDSPQWRRGPLGPGTLCNACGTRYARLQAKMNGDQKVGVDILSLRWAPGFRHPPVSARLSCC